MSLDCGRKPEYPVRNQSMHGENMQHPCRKTLGRELNPGPFCCKATVLPTAPPCSPYLHAGCIFVIKVRFVQDMNKVCLLTYSSTRDVDRCRSPRVTKGILDGSDAHR
ncbi:hypothetical protein ILYODFUR_022706 [Ilyodon furcidens]|uniref:Uncharacterized protein n=1 Tax=Ilyodon furcidens TaxID=33524 RepID=A0ABV0UUA9_9TELE